MILKNPFAASGLLAALLLACFTRPIAAQQTSILPSIKGVLAEYTASDLASLTPAARPGDVSSPEALVAALHASVSGPAGPIDWNRFRSLFLPAAHVTTLRTDAQGIRRIEASSLEDLITLAGPKREKVSWYEIILVSHIQKFHNIAVTIDSADGRRSPDSPAIERAVTTCEMLYDGKRWWIASSNSDVIPVSLGLPPELDPQKQKR